MDLEYISSLSDKITSVLRAHPEIPDHRIKHPWLIGALGSIPANIFLVAENPSLRQVEAATDPLTGGPATIESQWWHTEGDKLFRSALVESGLKLGTISSANDWEIYVTNVIKQPDYAEKWKMKTRPRLRAAAEIWAPVLAFELTQVNPRIVVAMGDKPHLLLSHLIKKGLIPHCEILKIHHYSYIGQRPDAKRPLGKMHPTRVKEYKLQVKHVAEFARTKHCDEC